MLLLFNRDDHDDDKTMIIVDTADGDVDKHDHDDYMTMYLKIFFHSILIMSSSMKRIEPPRKIA